MSEFTLGVDPEVFVTKNGKPISAHGMIPGDKENPHPTPDGAVQVDGMALEFNTTPVPANDFTAFNAKIISQLAVMKEMLPDKNLSLRIDPIATFTKEHLDEQPDKAKELGCDPDYNAYTMKQNPRPNADDVLFRSGAGHIHVGWGADIPIDNPDHIAICAGFIKTLDATVGMFTTYIDREPLRRELYGKAGAFRPKPYGVEYRTPSNVWIRNKEYRKCIHYLINKALGYAKNGRDCQVFTGKNEQQIREIIDTGDWKTAKNILDAIFGYAEASRTWNNVKSKMEG